MSDVRLSTRRLILRDFTLQDDAPLAEYLASTGDLALASAPHSIADVKAWLASICAERQAAPRAEYPLAIEHRESTALLGTCSLAISPESPTAAWIAYGVAPEWRSQGYAAEAAGALVAFGFSLPGIERLRATCTVDNVRSIGVLRRLGFWLEGRVGETGAGSLLSQESCLFALRRRDWLARRSRENNPSSEH